MGKGTQAEEQQSQSRVCRLPPRLEEGQSAAWLAQSAYGAQPGPCWFPAHTHFPFVYGVHLSSLGLSSSGTLTLIHHTSRTHPWPLLFHWTLWSSHPISSKESSDRLGETTKGSMCIMREFRTWFLYMLRRSWISLNRSVM